MNGFTIICNYCGNKIEIKKEEIYNNDGHIEGFGFYPIQSTTVNIICECNNEVYIEGGFYS